LFRAKYDVGASNRILLEVYTSELFIKTDDSKTTIWSKIGGEFSTSKTGLFCDLFIPITQHQETSSFFLDISYE
jgi:hypothetical protein